MVRAIFFTVIIGLVLISPQCTKYPEPLLLKDTLGISTSLSDVLKKKYGLFVAIHSKVSSTDDFISCKLLLFGDVEGHMDTRIATLGMKKTHNFLFKEVISIDSSSDVEVSSPLEDAPCVIKKDTLESIDNKKLPRVRNTYSDTTDLNKIFERSLNATDCVFVMTRSDSKRFSNRLKELIIKS
jgi:hypothetical protein